ncbi:MAG TPA: hypothetical protein VI685_01040 [Candidatus Angelobacter sp.]
MSEELLPGLLPHYRTQILGWKCSLCGQTFLLPEPREYANVGHVTAEVRAAFRAHECCNDEAGTNH